MHVVIATAADRCDACHVTLTVALLLTADMCLSICRSYLDYIKSGVFFYSFWITLMIVLITGTARISLFCMGYILACFIFLWFGEDMFLKPVRKLLSMWMGLLIYCYLVIMAKCVLQVRVVYWLANIVYKAVIGHQLNLHT